MFDTILPPAVADEATILARLEEALAVYPLPRPDRTYVHVDRSAGHAIDLSAELLQRLWKLPPSLAVWFRSTREMQAWAIHLGIPLEVDVKTFEDGRTCRTIRAGGSWLGWSVYLNSDEDSYRDVTPPATLAMVRKAHMGILL